MESAKEFPNVGDKVRINHTCYTHDGKRIYTAKELDYFVEGVVTLAKWAGGGRSHDGDFPDGWYVEVKTTHGDTVAFYRRDTGCFGNNYTIDPNDIKVEERGVTTLQRIAQLDEVLAALTAERNRLMGL